MKYIDGYLIPVPTANRDLYREHLKQAQLLFKEYGALEMSEFWGDDLPPGKQTSMQLAVDMQEGETVVFGLIAWESKESRDAAWEKLRGEERMHDTPMPFDGKRMIHGGFTEV